MTGKDKLLKLMYEAGGGYIHKAGSCDLLCVILPEKLKIEVDLRLSRIIKLNQHNNMYLLNTVLCTKGERRQLHEIIKAVRINNHLYLVRNWTMFNHPNSKYTMQYNFYLEEIMKS